MVTRRAPQGGLPFWSRPDPTLAPDGTIPSGGEVDTLGEPSMGWSQVRLPDGREVWVDDAKLLPPGVAPPEPRRSKTGLVVALVAVVVLVGAGVVTFVATRDDGETTITSGDDPPTTEAPGDGDDPPATTGGDDDGDDPPATTAQDGGDGGDDGDEPPATDPPTNGDGDDQPDDPPPVDGITFSDEMLAAAIAAGEADPLPGLPTLDRVATESLQGHMTAAGHDLTGLRLNVYPASTAPAMLVLETDDSTALLQQEDGGETFVVDLIGAPVLVDRGVEQLVLRHSSTDEEGPFTITFLIPLEALRAASSDPEADITQFVSVQVDRP